MWDRNNFGSILKSTEKSSRSWKQIVYKMKLFNTFSSSCHQVSLVKNNMAATEDSVRQAVDLDNLIQEYLQFEKVSWRISPFYVDMLLDYRVYMLSIEFLFL